MEVEESTTDLAIDQVNEIDGVITKSELSTIKEASIEISQTSELAADIKNLVFDNQPSCSVPIEISQTSELAADIKNLVFDSQPSCSGAIEISSESPSETSSEQSSTTETSGTSSENVEEVVKNKRKRKRRRKKKQPKAAETIPVPFTSRYKRFKKTIIPISAPKVHIRFDDTGNLDEEHSEFNRKPRIIRILETNLLINENLKSIKRESEPEIPNPINDNLAEEIVATISLKPRIIKAIII
ncbi:unnamed protein product [Diamesa tonsa]